MVVNSPLGKYAAPVAALSALGIIGAWIAVEIAAALSGGTIAAPAGLKEVALIAIGAVFGSAVAVNGYKAPLTAAHKRLDLIGAPPAADGEPK